MPSSHDRSRTLLSAQKESLELVVIGAPLVDVLARLVRTVEQESGGDTVAAIMLLDSGNRLRNGAAPSLPQHYLDAIDGLPADPGLGTCCAAAAKCEVVVTPDFATDPGWKGIAHLPIALGFAGAWSMPIVGRDGTVLGTFGTYFRTMREPTADERAVVEVLARTAAIAIERDHADAEQRRRTEELRKAKEAADAAAYAKGQFLAVVSHELRTPLSGIVGYADILSSHISGPLNQEQGTYVSRIKSGAWHLASIIDEILSYSRVEAGKESVALSRVGFRQLVSECVDLLRPQAVTKGIELRVHSDIGPLEVETDPGKIRQIVLNLTGNALKFTDCGVVEVAIRASGTELAVEVRDSGCGIPLDKRDQIFEPFVQVDQTHTRLAGGTGLGLTVSRRLANLLGGDVRLVDSTPGGGSTFALTLPLAGTRLDPPVDAPSGALELPVAPARLTLMA